VNGNKPDFHQAMNGKLYVQPGLFHDHSGGTRDACVVWVCHGVSNDPAWFAGPSQCTSGC
jgi:hypothetical protein